MKNTSIRLLVTALLFGSTVHCVHAAPVLLNTGNDYAPFTDEKLPEGGMLTELVKRVFKEMKQEIKIHWLPWARGYNEAKSGAYAATFPYVHTAARDSEFLYSDPLYVIQLKVFAKPSFSVDPAKPDSFRGKTICLPLGWAPPAKLEPLLNDGSLHRQQPKDISSCAKMVARGRADFFVTDTIQGAKAIAGDNLGPADITTLSTPVESTALHLIASKSNPKSAPLLAKFNAALKALKAEGVYDKIVAAHSK